MNKRTNLAIACAALVAISQSAIAKTGVEPLPLPVSSETVFSQSMNDPNVIFYHAEQAYKKGDYDESLRWMLEAAQYEHEAAIANTKFMIQNNLGTSENRESVVSFLKYYASPRGDDKADVFAQIYLANYYRGDNCVWLSNDEKADCVLGADSKTAKPMSATDLNRSYFYFEAAGEQGDVQSAYSAGMMNLLGLGVPRNVPLALSMLKPIAENGNAGVAYLVGSVYQLGYWMPQDRTEANKWFEMAAQSLHAGAQINLAKNAEAGYSKVDNETERAEQAKALYLAVIDGVTATSEERAEAAYRAGLLTASHPTVRDEVAASKFMEQAIKSSNGKVNEFTVKAMVWLGERLEHTDLAASVGIYKRALAGLKTLPIDVQQRHSSVWEKIAHAYGRGQEGNFDRDERYFSQYMQERHVLMSKSFIPSTENDTFQGYSAFHIPG